jgi:hypothetical protein
MRGPYKSIVLDRGSNLLRNAVGTSRASSGGSHAQTFLDGCCYFFGDDRRGTSPSTTGGVDGNRYCNCAQPCYDDEICRPVQGCATGHGGSPPSVATIGHCTASCDAPDADCQLGRPSYPHRSATGFLAGALTIAFLWGWLGCGGFGGRGLPGRRLLGGGGSPNTRRASRAEGGSAAAEAGHAERHRAKAVRGAVCI